MNKRIIFNLILVGVIFFAPWWVVGLVAMVGAFCFAPFYEVIVSGGLVDILYGANPLSLKGILGLVLGVLIFFAGIHIKKIVR